MKHLKMLGLAAIAALGLMAFVGAGTASATTLSTDPAGTIHYPVGTTFHFSLKPNTSATLETTGGSTIATCTESTFGLVLTGPAVETPDGIKYPSGTWIFGHIEDLTWGGCSQTTDTLANGSLELMRTGANEGEVVGKGSEVTLEIFGVSCVYGTGEGTTLGTVKGGETPEAAVNAVLPKISGGFLCPSTGRWTATYVLTSPHAAYIIE